MINARDAVLGQDAYVSCIFLWAADRFDLNEFQDKAPVTQRLEIAEALGVEVRELPNSVTDRFRVGLNLATSNEFWVKPRVFTDWANVMAGAELPREFTPPSVEEAAWAVFEALFIHENPERMSSDVQGYLEVMLKDGGYSIIPGVFKLAGQIKSSNSSTALSVAPDLVSAVGAGQKQLSRAIDDLAIREATDLLDHLKTILSREQLDAAHRRLRDLVKGIERHQR